MAITTKKILALLEEQADSAHPGVEVLTDYMQLNVSYQSALDEVTTKLKIIDRELSSGTTIGRKNAIHQIQTRIKSLKSIVKKLDKKGLAYSPAIIEQNLADIAGVRVICSYTDDIYLILHSLMQQTDVNVLQIKDYIKQPKPSGYRSLHVIVQIPVFFLEQTRQLKVEIQFRTIAMDYWASLEHGLRYKNNLAHSELTTRLEKAAVQINDLETEMLAIRQQLEHDHPVDM
ncbi:GTP pyrophosphokinase [Loigolactobacillus binensis]|uniref:GTP pyrophosphokinase family protein n=1 Tax=Loigolactobacillus binensis TaxID=2559922 RepID=A0ABW3EGE3_9LACO|nr:(p)ppGpp synthetase [Loigolactobacillus binensis]